MIELFGILSSSQSKYLIKFEKLDYHVDFIMELSSTGEMALQAEGLDVDGETFIEESITGLADELHDGQEPSANKDHIKLYGPEGGLSWVAKLAAGHSSLALVS